MKIYRGKALDYKHFTLTNSYQNLQLECFLSEMMDRSLFLGRFTTLTTDNIPLMIVSNRIEQIVLAIICEVCSKVQALVSCQENCKHGT